MKSGELTPDELFLVLGNRRRRWLLGRLRAGDGTGEVGALATALAECEARDRSRDAGADGSADDERTADPRDDGRVNHRRSRKSVYIALSQVHVPMLERTGVVTVASDGRRIRLTPRARRCFDHLDLVDGDPVEAASSATGPTTAQRPGR